MTAEPSPSLRERKKAETWLAIHDAAADLALDQDTTCVTVEAIASEAGVSQRTFFNYFPTKEDAILGVRAPRLDPHLQQDFLDGGDLLQRTAALLMRVGRSAYSEGDGDRRRRLFDRYPQLMLRRRELTLQTEDLVHQALAVAMAGHPDWADGLNGHSVEDTARMLTMAAGVPLRFSVMTQEGMSTAGPDEAAVNEAIGLYQELYRKLA